jgi:hypothetical protein
LDETLQHVAENPLFYRRVRGETKRAILGRFPYAVYFRVVGMTTWFWPSTADSTSAAGNPAPEDGWVRAV